MFYPKYLLRTLRLYAAGLGLLIPLAVYRWRLKKDPDVKNYMDQSLTPVTDDELETLEMYRVTEAAAAAVDVHKMKRSGRSREGATAHTG